MQNENIKHFTRKVHKLYAQLEISNLCSKKLNVSSECREWNVKNQTQWLL